ncbi:UDP-glucose 4-epimerase GalE [Pseudovibrio japonicus]|uniref:UDP-glucose 4-epimerase n=1 Tax=Pseudovibrio japonicus TaxID=366534 RepID=A0ABQ3ENW6_9HYPH|nr:UDP-glucose 4-epimerase GalE [Pseudovibrio japonicus]GHB43700.1 UDP-glucose 4-epimerase GalE [Pseudovibrio japonicus]
MSSTKNILVVGGAGYIGSHTTLALKEAGYTVVVYDNLSTGHRDACFGDVFVEGELKDRAKLAEVMEKHEIEGVVHFAALIEAGVSVVDPLSFYQNNVASTLALLEAMQDANVKRIVFSSTAAVYGDQTTSSPLSETLSKAPINPYGHSKAMVETILESAATAYGLQAFALRYFNAAGADPECRTGERHDPETHLIPLIIQTAQGVREHISVFGKDYETPDGTCIRDYIHVYDLAEGHVAALNFLQGQNTGCFHAANLGTGQGYSVLQVINAVAEISKKPVKIIEAERRPGDPAVLVADPSVANQLLNWRPMRSDLKSIVEDAWRFANA